MIVHNNKDGINMNLTTTTQLSVEEIAIENTKYVFFNVDFENNPWWKDGCHYEGITSKKHWDAFVNNPCSVMLENICSPTLCWGREFMSILSYTEESLWQLLNGFINFNRFVEMNDKIESFDNILSKMDLYLSKQLGIITESSCMLFSLNDEMIYFEAAFLVEGASSKVWLNKGENSLFLNEESLMSKESQALNWISKLNTIKTKYDFFNLPQENFPFFNENGYSKEFFDMSSQKDSIVYFKPQDDSLYNRAWNIAKEFYNNTGDIAFFKLSACIILFKLCKLDTIMSINFNVFVNNQLLFPDFSSSDFVNFIQRSELSYKLNNELVLKSSEKRSKL